VETVVHILDAPVFIGVQQLLAPVFIGVQVFATPVLITDHFVFILDVTV
jgi:hypothetical protein